jgi:hypothetical protein
VRARRVSERSSRGKDVGERKKGWRGGCLGPAKMASTPRLLDVDGNWHLLAASSSLTGYARQALIEAEGGECTVGWIDGEPQAVEMVSKRPSKTRGGGSRIKRGRDDL